MLSSMISGNKMDQIFIIIQAYKRWGSHSCSYENSNLLDWCYIIGK